MHRLSTGFGTNFGKKTDILQGKILDSVSGIDQVEVQLFVVPHHFSPSWFYLLTSVDDSRMVFPIKRLCNI